MAGRVLIVDDHEVVRHGLHSLLYSCQSGRFAADIGLDAPTRKSRKCRGIVCICKSGGRYRLRILIVDDNEPIRRGVARLLSSEVDWQVCGEAIDGTDALEKAQQLRPDLVLLDISMPGIDGLETARLLRKELPGVDILILSQHDSAQLLPRALAAGADGCVDKSRLSVDLVTAIKNISANRGTPTQGSP